jgi:hypothetical protein
VFVIFWLRKCFSFLSYRNLYFGANELSPPPESYNPDVDPTPKGTFDDFKIVNATINKVVQQLLN